MAYILRLVAADKLLTGLYKDEQMISTLALAVHAANRKIGPGITTRQKSGVVLALIEHESLYHEAPHSPDQP